VGCMTYSGNKILRVGVVGLGKMGFMHASLLSVLPNLSLRVLCDKSWVIGNISKRLFSHSEMVNDIGKLEEDYLDAVFITTPIPSHFSVAKALYSQRITRNLFVEKTLASNFNEAKELCRLAEDSGGVNMVGYHKRFSVTFMRAKDLLDEEILGELDSFDAYGYSSDFSGVNTRSKMSGTRGGVLKDLGSHVVDLALWFFGDLQVDSANIESLNDKGSEDHVYFTAKRSDGLRGCFDISWCKKEYRMPEWGLTIRGAKGVLAVNDDELTLNLIEGDSRKWYRHDLNDNVAFLLGAPEYFREDESFIKSISGNNYITSTFRSAANVDYVIDQVYTQCGAGEN